MKKFIAADATKWITENAIHAELGEQAEKMLALLYKCSCGRSSIGTIEKGQKLVVYTTSRYMEN